MTPYRQLTTTEMVRVDHAVDDIMAIVKEARKAKREAPCTQSAQHKSPARVAA